MLSRFFSIFTHATRDFSWAIIGHAAWRLVEQLLETDALDLLVLWVSLMFGASVVFGASLFPSIVI